MLKHRMKDFPGFMAVMILQDAKLMEWVAQLQQPVKRQLLAIREAASVLCGIAKDLDEAKTIPAVPKFCFITPPTDYKNTTGDTIGQSAIDIQARMISMGKLHPVLAITGGICIGVAAKIPGTLVNEAVGKAAAQEEIRIGHCSGILAVGADVKQTENGAEAVSSTVFRTARILIRGEVNISG